MAESAMRIVPEEELTAEQRAYAAERDALRRANESFAGGNQLNLEQMRRLVAEVDEQQAQLAADRRANAIARDLEQRQLAAEKAEKERVEHEARQEQLKARLKAYWVDTLALFTEHEFNTKWLTSRETLIAGIPDDDDRVREAVRRRVESEWNTP